MSEVKLWAIFLNKLPDFESFFGKNSRRKVLEPAMIRVLAFLSVLALLSTGTTSSSGESLKGIGHWLSILQLEEVTGN